MIANKVFCSWLWFVWSKDDTYARSGVEVSISWVVLKLKPLMYSSSNQQSKIKHAVDKVLCLTDNTIPLSPSFSCSLIDFLHRNGKRDPQKVHKRSFWLKTSMMMLCCCLVIVVYQFAKFVWWNPTTHCYKIMNSCNFVCWCCSILSITMHQNNALLSWSYWWLVVSS